MNKWNKKRLYYEIILPFSRILEDLEWNGIKIDLAKWEELRSDYESRISKLESKIFDYTGEINLNSYPQLREALYERLKIPHWVEDYELEKGKWISCKKEFLTDKGLKSTNMVALKTINAVHGHPVLDLILERSQLNTLNSRFVSGLEQFINPKGRIHAQYFQLTSGGRVNSSNPNTQNIPSRHEDGQKVRELFIAEPGYVILCRDYSAMELRFLAWFTKDRVMYPAFFKDNLDCHAITTSNIKEFKLTYEEAKKEKNKMKRFVGKTTGFLIIFGGWADTLQESLMKYGNIFIDKRRCASFIDAYYETYPDVKPFQERVEISLISHRKISNLFGRERFFDINPDDKKSVRDAFRRAFSHLIQGSSTGDYSAYKSVLLNKAIRKSGLDVRIWHLMHDGIYCHVKEDHLEKFRPIFQEVLETPDDPVTIELPTDEGIGKNWREAA